MNIYLSAPMRGWKDENRTTFNRAKRQLEAKGHLVYSPPDECDRLKQELAGVGEMLGVSSRAPTIRDYLQTDTRWILSVADVVLTIHPNWRDSKGCRAEVALAIAAGIPVSHGTWSSGMDGERLVF